MVRALEICLLSGHRASALRKRRLHNEIYGKRHGIWLNMSAEQLSDRIIRRTESLFGPALEAEVRALPPWEAIGPTARATIGLQEAVNWVGGDLDRARAVESVAIRTRQYARRQRTWFRKAIDLDDFHVDCVENGAPLMERLVSAWQARQRAD